MDVGQFSDQVTLVKRWCEESRLALDPQYILGMAELTPHHRPRNIDSYSTLCQDLPVEIIRLIFEWGARTRQTGSVLCRVSNVVFRWTVPIFYHTIVLREPQDARSFDVAIDSIRGQYYLDAVRNVSLPRYGQPPHLHKCTRIKSIAIYAYDAMGKYAVSLNLPKLSRLTIYDQSRYFNLRDPLSLGLTHLVVSQQFMLVQDLSNVSLPNLTHFLTPVLTNGGRNCEIIYRRLFSQLNMYPKLRIIGLMVFRVDSRKVVPDTRISRQAALRIIGQEDDARIVVFPRPIVDGHESWEKCCTEEQDVWEFAEWLSLSCLREHPEKRHLSALDFRSHPSAA